MVSLISPSRWVYVGTVAIMLLLWPCRAVAGWFVRSDQIAYRLEQQGHDRQALKYWDGSAKGLYGKGTTLMHLGRMREAEQAFRGSLEVAPHKTGYYDSKEMPASMQPHFMASLWYNLGNSLYEQDELRGARQAWQKALSYEPDHVKAQHNLEIVDHLLGSNEPENQTNMTGLSGVSNKKSPGKHAKQHSAGNKQQLQHHRGFLKLHLPGTQKQESSAGSKKGKKQEKPLSSTGQGKGLNKLSRSSSHNSSSRSGNLTPKQGNNSHQDKKQADPQGMSRNQAVLDLRMVEEGVSVFMRHRLGEKGPSGISADGGKPW